MTAIQPTGLATVTITSQGTLTTAIRLAGAVAVTVTAASTFEPPGVTPSVMLRGIRATSVTLTGIRSTMVTLVGYRD
jgi:hypothetical protein